jgi:hypothetical protein
MSTLSILAMAMFLLLVDFRHQVGPGNTLMKGCAILLAMSLSSEAFLDHIADYLRFISNAQSFWFMLNTSMTMAATLPVDSVWTRKTEMLCCLLSCRVMPAGCGIASCRPLIAPPSCCLDAPAGCCITSCHPLIAPPSCHLVAPIGCCIASHRPLVAPPSRQLVAPACSHTASPCPLVAPCAALSSSHCTSWLLRRLSMCRPLVVLLSCCAASCCLVAPAGCCAIISRHPIVAPPSHHLIMLAGCCVASPCAALSSTCHIPLPMPSNAVKHCCRHQTPPPPPPLIAVYIVLHCHSCHPSPPSNTNAHLRPSLPSNYDTRCRHLPPLMSISIVTSSSSICSPHHRCRRMLPPPFNAISIVHRH